MKFMIQRVSSATVTVENKEIGAIQQGLVVFVGVSHDDSREIADKLLKKLVQLRIFEDEQGKTNLSIADINGSLLIISQFTLYANCKKGNRPSFIDAGSPDLAQNLYDYIVEKVRETVLQVETGSFGADMKVSLINDGPFSIMLDSKEF